MFEVPANLLQPLAMAALRAPGINRSLIDQAVAATTAAAHAGLLD
jgi:hypothetical protein